MFQNTTTMTGVCLSIVISLITWMLSVNAKLAVISNQIGEFSLKFDALSKSHKSSNENYIQQNATIKLLNHQINCILEKIHYSGNQDHSQKNLCVNDINTITSQNSEVIN